MKRIQVGFLTVLGFPPAQQVPARTSTSAARYEALSAVLEPSPTSSKYPTPHCFSIVKGSYGHNPFDRVALMDKGELLVSAVPRELKARAQQPCFGCGALRKKMLSVGRLRFSWAKLLTRASMTWASQV